MAVQEIAERNPGGPTMVIEADVTQAQDMERAVSRTIEEFWELSVGINNAGIAQWFDAMEMSEEDLRRMFDVVRGLLWGRRTGAADGHDRLWKNHQYCVHFGLHREPPAVTAHYNEAESAVLGFTRSLAVKWVDHGIRVNSISPGCTRTAIVDHFLGTPSGAGELQNRPPA